MKLSLRSVIVRDKHPSGSTAMYSTDKGHQIDFVDGLVFIKEKDVERITPASNVIWMDKAPETQPAKK